MQNPKILQLAYWAPAASLLLADLTFGVCFFAWSAVAALTFVVVCLLAVGRTIARDLNALCVIIPSLLASFILFHPTVTRNLVYERLRVQTAIFAEQYKLGGLSTAYPRARWTVAGHQGVREYQILYVLKPEALAAELQHWSGPGCDVDGRQLNAEFAVLSIDCR